MSYFKIATMCKNIEADYRGMGRKVRLEDGIILDTIMRLYNTTEIDWEEVKWLWIEYLETGNLYFSDAVEMAKSRKAKENMEAMLKIKSLFV